MSSGHNGNQPLKAFLVTARCGHVGQTRYIPITYPVLAKDGTEAAAQVRDFPRVKHHQKLAILKVEAVAWADYQHQKDINRMDPYLRCRNRQQQTVFEEEIMARSFDNDPIDETDDAGFDTCMLFIGKRKVRISPKKLIRYIDLEEILHLSHADHKLV